MLMAAAVFPTPGGPENIRWGTFLLLTYDLSLLTISSWPTTSSRLVGLYFSIQISSFIANPSLKRPGSYLYIKFPLIPERLIPEMIDGGNAIRMKQLTTNVQKFLYIAASQLCSEVNSVYISKIAVLALALLAVPASMGIPNPSSVYCHDLGYDTETRTNPETGGQSGYCVFPDGSSCPTWAFYRGECGQNFTYCEQQGYRIENRVEDMGTFTVKYAACVFDDCSECGEQEYVDGECGPSNCSRWTMKDGCKLAVESEGLISKVARINNSAGQTAEDVKGWDVVYMGEDGKCYTYYVAQVPLIGMTEPVEVDSPLGVRAFDSYMLDYEVAIAAMKSMRCGSTFVELSLYWPLTPEVEEPEWHIKTEIGNEIVIGANSGKSRC